LRGLVTAFHQVLGPVLVLSFSLQLWAWHTLDLMHLARTTLELVEAHHQLLFLLELSKTFSKDYKQLLVHNASLDPNPKM
jgi:hypothetical protein